MGPTVEGFVVEVGCVHVGLVDGRLPPQVLLGQKRALVGPLIAGGSACERTKAHRPSGVRPSSAISSRLGPAAQVNAPALVAIVTGRHTPRPAPAIWRRRRESQDYRSRCAHA